MNTFKVKMSWTPPSITMTFTSDKLKFEGKNLAAVDGPLTLKGISKPVTLTVTSFQCMPHPMLKKRRMRR